MKKTLNIKKMLIISIILLIVIIAIRYIIMQKRQESKVFESVNEIKTTQDVMTYLDSKYKKQEKSKEENYTWDIYAILNRDLYTNGNSNEAFYNDLVGLTAKVLDYSNYRIIDESKRLVISVLCDIENDKIIKVYINGEANYFGKKDSESSVKNYEEEKLTNLQLQSLELGQAIDSKWIATIPNFGSKDIAYEKYDVYEDEGIEIRTIARRIFNIVFTQNYQKNIVNNIKVGTDLEDVKEILGEPTYYNEDTGIIGYKSKYIYIFFSAEEISIYPVEEDDYYKAEFAKLVSKFISDRDAKSFANATTDIWEDYDVFNYDSNHIDLRYSLRGVKIQFNITSNHGVILSNNYVGQVTKDYTIDNLRTLIEMPKYIYFEDNNSVLEAEVERYIHKLEYLEEMNITDEPID